MALVAEGPIRDPKNGFVYRLRETARGWEGERNWLVNHDIEEIALTAPGIPPMGAPWANTPDEAVACVVLSREAFRVGGQDTNGQGGTGGWARVQCIYGPEDAGGAFTAGLDGKSWTEIRSVSNSIVAKYPYKRELTDPYTANGSPPSPPNQSGIPPYTQIQGGDGAPIIAGGCEARVHAYIKPSVISAYLIRLLQLSKPAKLNANRIVLPRIQNTKGNWTLDEGQALFTGFEVGPTVNGKSEVISVLALDSDWRYTWQAEDSSGAGAPVLIWDTIYLRENFDSLW